METKKKLFELVAAFACGFLVIFQWRGAWILLDIYLLPESMYISAAWGLGIGSFALIVSFLVEWNKIRKRMFLSLSHHFYIPAIIVDRIILFLHCLCAVAVWRGVWYLSDKIFPGDLEKSAWLSFLVGSVCLTLAFSLRSSLAPPFVYASDLFDEDIEANLASISPTEISYSSSKSTSGKKRFVISPWIVTPQSILQFKSTNAFFDKSQNKF